MLEKLFDMKPIRWNSPSSCCCNRTAPMAKLDASHSRWKGPDLDGKVSMGAEVMVLFSASKACCSAAPHDQSFDFWVSVWRGRCRRDISLVSNAPIYPSFGLQNIPLPLQVKNPTTGMLF